MKIFKRIVSFVFSALVVMGVLIVLQAAGLDLIQIIVDSISTIGKMT